MKSRDIKIASVYVFFTIFYMWISANTPLSADDWIWGSETGMHDFLNATQNSRYVGNFVEIIMTRSMTLRVVIMGVVSVLIPFLIADFVVEDKDATLRLFYFVLSNILFLTARKMIWSETNGWIAGFANFVISSVFVLLHFCIWSDVLKASLIHENDCIWKCILLFFSSLAGQLFIENLTIVMFALSVVVSVIYHKRTKQISWKYLLMAGGSFLGMLIMFSSSIYTSLFQQGEALNGYRQIIFLTNRSIGSLVYTFVYQCARLVVRLGEENLGLTIFILFILIKRLRLHPFDKGVKVLCVINALLMVYYSVILIGNVRYNNESFKMAMISAVVNGLYVLCISVSLYRLFRSGDTDAIKALALWVCALATIMPLLVTNENGSRLLYTFVVISILMSAILSYPILKNCLRDSNHFARVFVCILLIAFCLMPRFWVVYAANGRCERQRVEIITEALEDKKETIILPVFPYKEYAGRSTPISEDALQAFKEFYHIPADVNIFFE